jgi:hypothetical protein
MVERRYSLAHGSTSGVSAIEHHGSRWATKADGPSFFVSAYELEGSDNQFTR